MLLPSSRAACPDVEEIMLLFDYSRIYTGIWGLKRISLSFVLILAVISSHTMASSMNSGTRKKASKRCQYFILYGHCYCFALEQNLCRKKNKPPTISAWLKSFPILQFCLNLLIAKITKMGRQYEHHWKQLPSPDMPLEQKQLTQPVAGWYPVPAPKKRLTAASPHQLYQFAETNCFSYLRVSPGRGSSFQALRTR